MRNVWKKLAVCLFAATMTVSVRTVFSPDVSVVADETTETTYTITYENTFNASNKSNPTTYSASDEAVTLSDITRRGYTFSGWYTDEALTQKITEISAGTTGDLTLYAGWELETYTLTYNLDGGEPSPDNNNPTSYTVEDDSFLLDTPTKAGYKFCGWYNAKNYINVGSDTNYTITLNGLTVSNNYEQLDEKCKLFIPTNQSGDMTLKTLWQPIKYTVVLHYGVGADFGTNTMSCVYDETDITLPAPSSARDGYVFSGVWNTKEDGTGTSYKNGKTVRNLVTEANTTVDLYAIWNPVSYLLVYELNGGTGSSANPSYYTVESSVTLADPTRKGYSFDGWYEDKDLKTAISAISEGSSGSKTLYAKWVPIQYSLNFDGNGSTAGVMSKETATYGSSCTLTANSFRKNGYSFASWNTKADGSGTNYPDKASVKNLSSTEGGSIKLYAQWKPAAYNITYHLNGGTNDSENPTSYTYSTNGENTTFEKPTRAGYTFAGWYSDATLKTAVSSIKKGTYGDVDLYAKWTPIKYSVTFKGNGSTSGSMSAMKSLKYDSSYSLSKNKFKKKGYTFAGWNTKKDGSGKSYADTASITKLTKKSKGKVTLYAQWESAKYSITYNLNGGTNNTKNPSAYNSTQKVTLKNPVKEGYTFAGWYSDKKFRNKVTSIKKGSSGNKTLYAKWKANTYKIVFDGNGSTAGSMSSQTKLTYTKKYKLTKNKYTKKNYSFAGWNTEKDGSGISYKNAASVKKLTSKKNGTVTLYAQWTVKEKFSITYQLNGGTNNAKNAASYSSSTGMTLASPTRSGYNFAGWYSDSALKTPVSEISAGAIGDKTFYAKWTAKTYSVAFNGNGATAGTMKKQTNLSFAETYTLTKNAFTRTGYTFTGWNTKKDGSGKSYKNAAQIKGLASADGDTVTLYATWKYSAYTITYTLNGGTNSSKNPDTYSSGNAVTLHDPERKGYSFAGWYTDKKLTAKITKISSDSTGNLTLYAGWTAIYVETTCTTCNGAKTVTCSNCSGNKSLTCRSCDGDKYVIVHGQGKQKCSSCAGTGTRQCTTCKGNGHITCPNCDGAGTIRTTAD
jgi:uncharacterized repeat protein (TIGR02543 family)